MLKPEEWTVKIAPGAITRSIMWGYKEVALVNPRGDFSDETERDLAAGLAHAAKMHALLKRIADSTPHGEVLSSHILEQVRALVSSVEMIDVGVMVEPED